MKKTLSTFLDKIEHHDSMMRLYRKEKSDEIEILLDEFTDRVRGGDREYIPMYDHSTNDSIWQNPTILLNL
jgi:hypothetical protein